MEIDNLDSVPVNLLGGWRKVGHFFWIMMDTVVIHFGTIIANYLNEEFSISWKLFLCTRIESIFMKNKFYFYSFLLIGFLNMSSAGWSANVDVSEDLSTQGGYTTKSNSNERSLYFNLEAGSSDKDNGTITQTEIFNTLKAKGSIMLNQAFVPSLTGNKVFALDPACLNYEIFKSQTISSIDFNGQCEFTTKGLSCTDMSIRFNVYDRELNIVPAVQISCNANIYNN